MKKHTNQLKKILFVAWMALPALAFAGKNGDVDKKRTISRNYSVGATDKLDIVNSFGKVVVNTWDKNEIKVDVEIGVKASSDQEAADMMDEIEVKDHQAGNTISFKTTVGNISDGKNKHKNNEDGDRKFYIDYMVYMPAANPLSIENSFGQTTVPDINGEVNLTSKFGGLKTGNLNNVESVDVEFGTAELGAVHNGEFSFKFNSKSLIARVSGSVKIKSEFSSNVRLTIGDDIQDLSLSESYSSINLAVSKSLSASFDVRTSFGDFRNGTDFNIAEARDDDDNGPRFDRQYAGNAGNGKAKIRIKSSFGKIRLLDGSSNSSSKDDDGDDDDDNPGKNKSKDKNKTKVSV